MPPAGQGRYPYDVNQVALSYLQQYRLLVLRRSPIATRPPANFRRVYSTRSYDVWERGPAPQVLEHLPIATAKTEAGGVAACAQLRSVAARAVARGARLAYVERRPTSSLIPTQAKHPRDWGQVFGDPNALIQRGKAGDVRGSVLVATPGRYRVWLQGTFDRALSIYVAGRRVGRAGPRELGPPGSFVPVGAIRLPATSGQGVPAIPDWVECGIPDDPNGDPWRMGLEPHPLTIYESPNTGHTIAVLANSPMPTFLALVDVTQMIDPAVLPRTPGANTCAEGVLPSSLVRFVSLP